MKQVAKKKFKDDPSKGDEFMKEAMNRCARLAGWKLDVQKLLWHRTG